MCNHLVLKVDINHRGKVGICEDGAQCFVSFKVVNLDESRLLFGAAIAEHDGFASILLAIWYTVSTE